MACRSQKIVVPCLYWSLRRLLELVLLRCRTEREKEMEILQTDEPSAPEARANWLPTPQGDFRPLLRMYEPDAIVFDGGYELPPITKLPS